MYTHKQKSLQRHALFLEIKYDGYYCNNISNGKCKILIGPANHPIKLCRDISGTSVRFVRISSTNRTDGKQ